MLTTSPTQKRSRIPFIALVIGLIIIGYWSYATLRQTEATYDGVLELSAQMAPTVETASIGTNKLSVPTWSIFKAGQLWALVSNKHPLPPSFKPPTLVDMPIAHGDASSEMKVSNVMAGHLNALAAAAEKAGYPLMASSAYRSISDQQTLFDAFVNRYGADFAKEYVSDPGASEHHTGLAVDLSTKSSACSADSNACSLGTAEAAWLMANAATFGFIQRYPEGDSAITGISSEPWHYRYVGVTLAKAMSGSVLTLDQVVAQLAPGYAK